MTVLAWGVAATAVATAVALGLMTIHQRRRLRRLEDAVSRLEGELRRARRPLLRPGGSPGRIAAAGEAVRAVLDTATRVRDEGVGGFLATSLEDLNRWVADDTGAIARVAGEDGRATILFSDIEDSTALNTRLGDRRWVRLLAAHERLVVRHVGRHGGHVVKNQGDGFMVVFPDPTTACRAALSIQAALHTRSASARLAPVRVRIGLHPGRVISRGEDYYGRNVAMAARVAGCAVGGEVLASERAAGLLDDEFDLEEVHAVTLKGFDGEHRLYRVTSGQASGGIS